MVENQSIGWIYAAQIVCFPLHLRKIYDVLRRFIGHLRLF